MRITNFHILITIILTGAVWFFSLYFLDKGAPLKRQAHTTDIRAGLGAHESGVRTRRMKKKNSLSSVGRLPAKPVLRRTGLSKTSVGGLEKARVRAEKSLQQAAEVIDAAMQRGEDTAGKVKAYQQAKKALSKAETPGDFNRAKLLAEQVLHTGSKDSLQAPIKKTSVKIIKRTDAHKGREAKKKSRRSRSGRYRLYRIKKGDTLWRIAKKPAVYGQGAGWVKIWRANQKKIPDFDQLPVGMVLKIPD